MQQTALVNPTEERQLVQRAYRRLLRSIKTKKSKKDRLLIRKAYEMAWKAHQTQRRKSGEAYIFHPIEVARICAGEIGLGTVSVVSALLHDVVEDTEVTLDDIRSAFGERIAMIVDGLTKFNNIFAVESAQAENFRKILSTLAKDARVVLIKMADRLHNMRTLGSMPANKRYKIASETAYVYAPLAHRLGLYNMKTEFQDICLEILEPDKYRFLKEKLQQTKRERKRYINKFIEPLKPQLNEALIYPYKIYGRAKSISSIANKMKNKGVSFEEVYDLFAVRVVIDVKVEEEKDLEKEERFACWKTYSIITNKYQPNPDRLKDWIATPKSNGYESLHTTVVGPNGRFVEVQIRTTRMDEIAEKGLAAHWKYKGIKTENVFDRWLNGVRELLNNPAENALDFLDEFKTNLFSKEVYVFTPNGDMKLLPKGATALDFAFAIHTEIGAHCKAVKVNQKLVPMGQPLKNGDQVQVITVRNQKPNKGWLKLVTTGKAKSRIRRALKEEKRKQGEYGKETLMRKLKSMKANFDDYNVDFLVKHVNLESRMEFYYAIAKGTIQLQQALKELDVEGGKLYKHEEIIIEDKSEWIPKPSQKRNNKKPDGKPKLMINGEDASKINYVLANCCNPVQGDEVFGFLSIGGMIKIHRTSCPNSTNLMAKYGYRVLKAEWLNSQNTSFTVDLGLTGIDSIGVVQRLTDVITTKLRINMRSIFLEGSNEGYYKGKIRVVVYNKDQLHFLMQTLREMDEVNSVHRIES